MNIQGELVMPMIQPTPSREELNIGPRTAQLLEMVDAIEDGDTLASALETALLALVDISGDDPNRPTISRPGKLARRSITRITEILEEEENNE